MNAVAAQFAHIRSTEAAGHVESEIRVVAEVPYGTDAACSTSEVERMEVDMAVVEAQASVERHTS